jgi:hypothetical protein
MPTPYITTAMLTSRPAGISWNVVPTLTANTAEQTAQLDQVCWSATSTVDSYCQQPLRATVTTETNDGPGVPRVSVDRQSGATTLTTRSRHVTDALAVAVSLARAFPEQWSTVQAGQYRLTRPVFSGSGPSTGPIGGNSIDLAPGIIDWRHGRGGWRVQLSYASGWPHTSLTAPALAGATVVSVDDITGWSRGWSGFCYDGAQTEPVTVNGVLGVPVALPNGAGSVMAGPGTLSLAAPLTQPHPAGAVISALPAAVLRAAALAAAVEALQTIDAIATQSLSGELAGGTGALATEVEMILDPYARII